MSNFSPIASFTGATDTVVSGTSYKYLTFNSSGTVIFNNPIICDILLVAGGGGGGNSGQNEGGGGGGGGGVGIGNILFNSNITYTITVGAGGANNAVGVNTTIIGGNINEVAYGGGYGSATNGGDGGSGGGGGGYIGSHYGGKATMGLSSTINNSASIIYYGNHGGWCAWTGGAAGGGGSKNMGTESRGNVGAVGGSGILWTINNVYYGGGGGAGGGYGNVGGAGGSGGGANGGTAGYIGNNATGNTGGGGGGGGSGYINGGSGSSGILIIRYSIISNISDNNKTVRFSTLRNSYSLSNEYRISNFRNKSPNNINNVIYLSSYLVSKTTQGLCSLNPGKNALQIKNNTGVTAEGSYYIMCNNIPTLIYCLMDSKYDGGGWMMMIKATETATTFQYEANYWTTENILNKTDLTRNNADAKYDSFNFVPIKDVMAIWPDPASFDAPSGGSLNIANEGWVWLVNNWYNNGGYVKALNGFQFPRDANPPNPYNFSGWKNGIFSTQSSDYRHIFGGHSHIGNGNNNWGTARWGFIWNENGAGNFDSCDVWNGIGVSRAFGAFGNGGKSAGDNYGCCGSTGAKTNWTMRIQLYGR
jgi:hypothetical protein